MIPLTLTLKNFMCYRDNVPTLHLEGVHVACLCGANGHGKSALLDAITWALWGQARARTQDELVHHGQRNMQVDLEFLARGERYRVSRRHTRPRTGRQGATVLDLFVSSENGYRAISGNTVRDTEARIQHLLSMDYTTFVNSAFLLQGRADEFTRATPARRKEVLAQILNLGLYDRLEERAKEYGAASRQQAALLLDQVEQLRQAAEQRPQFQAELDLASRQLADLHPELEAKEQAVRQAHLAYDRLAQAQEELAQIDRRLREAAEEEAQLQAQAQQHQQRIQAFHQALDMAQQVEADYARLQETHSALGELDQKQGQASHLQQRKANLDTAIALARQRLEQEVQHRRQELAQRLDPLVQAIPTLQQQVAQAQQQLESLQAEERKLEQQRLQLQQVTAEHQALNQHQAQVEQQGHDLRARLDLLQSAHDTIRCPLCNTELGEQGRSHLFVTYESQVQERRQTYRDLTDQLRALETERSQLQRTLGERDRSLTNQRAKLQGQAATLQHQLDQARKAEQQRDEAQTNLQILEATLATARYAVPEQEQLRQLNDQLNLLGYDPQAHEAARHLVRFLEPSEQTYRRLQEARQRLPDEERDLLTMQALIQRRHQAAQQDLARQGDLRHQVAQLPQARQRLDDAEAAERTLTQHQIDLTARKATLEAAIRDSKSREQEAAHKQEQLQRAQREQSIFTDLAAAFGKGGLQALLIEAVVPDLEAEANQLLHRLTQGRMSLKLETQRQRRTRSDAPPIETLDIIVADELGSRSYELFSGGETFRINFALRIALSKLLARRAGAPLPTLFIDEGFGTQDAEGREQLLDAIKSIEPDFERIIVITHIDEVKERFPVRIEVTKTESGSTFEIT